MTLEPTHIQYHLSLVYIMEYFSDVHVKQYRMKLWVYGASVAFLNRWSKGLYIKVYRWNKYSQLRIKLMRIQTSAIFKQVECK
jgi:hypothetical protein